MSIAIVSGSAKITNACAAAPNAPTANHGTASFSCSPMHAEGSVQFSGGAHEAGQGWAVGWIQAEWIETNWAYYRGQHDSGGSIFLQRARPPARPTQSCRDTSGPVSTIFTDPTDPKEYQTLAHVTRFPHTVNVQTNDPPGESYNLVETNSKTHVANYLHEVQIEFHFCTVLVVRDPAQRFHQQAHFYWNTHWQYQFHPQSFQANATGPWVIRPVPAGIGSNTGPVIEGAATDHRFSDVLTTPQQRSCVDLAGLSGTAVAIVGNPCRRENTTWTNGDVRR